MKYPEETITLRDGRTCLLHSARPEDAARMLDYMKIMLGESPYLLRKPEEFDYTADAEAAILQRIQDAPRDLMLVAEMNGEIIACADIRGHGPKSRTRHRANLGMSVRRDFWHQGIGSALMERLIAFARQAAYEQIELEVVAANRRALGLYLKFGFQVYGTRPHGMKYRDGSYADEYLMVKKL